ncbi:dimethylarginine dimethylaminohydrolase family protein [Ectopseudomonas chengduensis]|nr:arginine deiminase family protein [Pseudomonas chengduensis]MDH1281556.1 arginine deiminase family protein [Pseudomonas chengduensis]
MMPYIDNEYGKLEAVLLSQPVLCNRHPEFPTEKSLDQYARLVSELKSRDIHCVFIESEPELPYQCYTRDSSIFTPFGVYVNNMGFCEREKETQLIKGVASDNGWPVVHEAQQGTLEGGDVIVVRNGLVVIGTNKLRTSLSGAAEIQDLFLQKGWKALIVNYDVSLRHLDVAMGVIDEHTIVYAVEKIGEEEIDRLRMLGIECIPVDVSETPFACNFVNLGGRELLTSVLCAGTRAVFNSLDCTVIEVDLSEFIMDDGGPHCLIQCIARETLKDYR